MGGEYPYNPQKFDKMIELRDKEPNSHFCFAIEIDNEMVGEIGLNRIERKISNHVATIGYWLTEKYWGQGIMTKALELACDYAFEELKFNNLYLSGLFNQVNLLSFSLLFLSHRRF